MPSKRPFSIDVKTLPKNLISHNGLKSKYIMDFDAFTRLIASLIYLEEQKVITKRILGAWSSVSISNERSRVFSNLSQSKQGEEV